MSYLAITFRCQLRILYLVYRLPGPLAFPVVGNVHQLVLHRNRFFEMTCNGRKAYGPICRVWVTVFPMIVVSEPKHIQEILMSSKHLDKSYFYTMLDNFVGEGLVTIADVVLGVPTDEITSSTIRQGSMNLLYRWFRPWLLVDSIYGLTESGKKEISQKNYSVNFIKKAYYRGGEKRVRPQNNTYLDFLLEKNLQNKEFTIDDCIQEARTLMLAGQESVATGIAFCLHQLANHEDIQEKAFREIYSILKDSKTLPTITDLKNMKYLEQCIKETLRLYPSIPFIGRKLAEDIRIGGFTLPKGCEVVIAIAVTHRLSEHYSDPDKFNPDRFEVSISEERHPYAYLPFSAGPRNCIGGYKFGFFEMKIIVSSILRKFKLSPVPGRNNLCVRYGVSLRNSGGVWINFTPRS